MSVLLILKMVLRPRSQNLWHPASPLSFVIFFSELTRAVVLVIAALLVVAAVEVVVEVVVRRGVLVLEA